MNLPLRIALSLSGLVLLLAGCSRRASDAAFDGVSGNVTTSQQVDQQVLIPAQVKFDSRLENYTIIEHLVFLGESDTTRRAVTVTFRRSLNDNELIRAERDFSGFTFNGQYWQALPYTKARHDSTRLDLAYNFPFGGLDWDNKHTSGRFRYDWHGVKVGVEFRDLTAVQDNRHAGYNRRSHAIGTGVMIAGTDTLTGAVFYELIQVEDYNPIRKIETGIEYTNYDWVALLTPDGKTLIASSDSTTAGDKILKNFVVLKDKNTAKFADGSTNVRIASEGFQRDHKIYDMIALKKSLSVPELKLNLRLDLVEPRVFYTTGYCLSVVTGALESDGTNIPAWGIIEHWQQPKSDASVLR